MPVKSLRPLVKAQPGYNNLSHTIVTAVPIKRVPTVILIPDAYYLRVSGAK